VRIASETIDLVKHSFDNCIMGTLAKYSFLLNLEDCVVL